MALKRRNNALRNGGWTNNLRRRQEKFSLWHKPSKIDTKIKKTHCSYAAPKMLLELKKSLAIVLPKALMEQRHVAPSYDQETENLRQIQAAGDVGEKLAKKEH